MKRNHLITLVSVAALLVIGVAVFSFAFIHNTPPTAEAPTVVTPGQTTSNENGKKPAFVVEMNDNGFTPEEITVHTGDTVLFINKSEAAHHWPASDLHPTHEIYPEFDPLEPIVPGASWQFTFDRVGDWRYHDHLRASKRGIVHVLQ